MRRLVPEYSDATLAALSAQLEVQHGLRVSVPTMGTHRPLPEAAAPNKSLHADERETDRVQQARTAYQAEIAALDATRCKCIDESGVNLAMTRR